MSQKQMNRYISAKRREKNDKKYEYLTDESLTIQVRIIRGFKELGFTENTIREILINKLDEDILNEFRSN